MKTVSRINNSRGYTLIEIIIVIVLISIIVAIAIPNLLAYMPKSRLNGATRVVAGDLMATRMDAVKMNRTVKLEYLDTQTYKIAYMGTSSEVILKALDLSGEYPDVSFKDDFDKVEFNSRGAAILGSEKTVTLENLSGEKTIDVGISGRVKIN